ncbi:MAG TPA: DUF488 domain-containing protein [Solirubrobacteraceae bacterium]|nr:DUF488 domain-containing protein [Solirubrobacteraceae bacterium]
MAVDIRVKRIYEPATAGDGYRVLVDRVWPRGISRERAQLDEWARELAPSDELRRWFGHVPERFAQFRDRYRAELEARSDELARLRQRAQEGTVTVLYGARDDRHNNAIVVAELLRDG